MEITCHRCHRTIEDENCYCPACGLPKLTYEADETAAPQPAQWDEAVMDADGIDWKVALRGALLMAIPAGLLSSEGSPIAGFGLLMMPAAALLAVVFYVRKRQPAWITAGAGARIGLVTGILAGWMLFTASGGAMFVERFVLHQAAQIDAEFDSTFMAAFQQRTLQSTAGMGQADAAQAQAFFAGMMTWLKSPEGHAGMWAASFGMSALFLLLFSMAGGVIGARVMARRRRPEL
jgi:hypothetical protein